MAEYTFLPESPGVVKQNVELRDEKPSAARKTSFPAFLGKVKALSGLPANGLIELPAGTRRESRFLK